MKPFLIVINKIDQRKKSTNKLIEMYKIERLFIERQNLGLLNVLVEKIKMWLDDAMLIIINNNYNFVFN